jgi:hypothetical protein
VQTDFQGSALLVGERSDKNGWPHSSQDTPFRPTFTENALGQYTHCHAAMRSTLAIIATSVTYVDPRTGYSSRGRLHVN